MKLPLALLLTLAAAPLSADVLVVTDGAIEVRPASIELPKKGSTMAAVEAKFGVPRERHAAIGQPPITRWDYDRFSVYFEFQHVVHAVEATAPAPAPAG